MKNNKIFLISVSALLAAMFPVAAIFSIPLLNGYVHLGDVLCYIAACLLPMPFAAVSAGIGGALADIFLGYTVYAPFTFVLKAFFSLLFTSKTDKIICKRNIIGAFLAIIVTGGGYFIADTLLYSLEGALATLPYNIAQGAVSLVLFLPIATLLDKLKIKKSFFKA